MGIHREGVAVGDTVGEKVREWETQLCGGYTVRESQWETQWREGEGVAVGDTVGEKVRESQWETQLCGDTP